MVHFVGAGPGAPDLLTLRGADLLQSADVVIYAGSLVNPAVLDRARPGAAVYDSAAMTLEEILSVMEAAAGAGQTVVRLHSGDPCLYGALREQTEALDALDIPWDVTPGVSSFCAAAAALGTEYTVPGAGQSVILTRLSGRTAVPEGESLRALSAHGTAVAVFLSAGTLDRVQAELLAGGAFTSDTPAAIVYKASWPEEQIVRCTVGTLAEAGKQAGIQKSALILSGDFLQTASIERSRLYDPAFSTAYRQGTEAVPSGREAVSFDGGAESRLSGREAVSSNSGTAEGAPPDNGTEEP